MYTKTVDSFIIIDTTRFSVFTLQFTHIVDQQFDRDPLEFVEGFFEDLTIKGIKIMVFVMSDTWIQ